MTPKISALAAHAFGRRCASCQANATTRMTTEAEGRYIRRSATISLKSGNTLEDGARIRKKQAPRNPGHALRKTQMVVATSIAKRKKAGSATEEKFWASGQSR